MCIRDRVQTIQNRVDPLMVIRVTAIPTLITQIVREAPIMVIIVTIITIIVRVPIIVIPLIIGFLALE